jgi:hypothetical protein
MGRPAFFAFIVFAAQLYAPVVLQSRTKMELSSVIF